MIPLKVIERVLPWLVGLLTENEARNLLKNMQSAGSYIMLLVATYYEYFLFKNHY